MCVVTKREESPERELFFSPQPYGPLSPAQQSVDVPREIARESEVRESLSVLGREMWKSNTTLCCVPRVYRYSICTYVRSALLKETGS